MMVNKNNSAELPKGWLWTNLGDICLSPQYGWTTRASDYGKLRLIRTSDITSGQINWQSVPYCQKEPDKVKKYVLKDGDIVISRAGSVGYSILVKKPEKAVFASYLIRFRPLITAQFVAYFLKSPQYWQSISEKKLGIAVPNVNATKLKQIRFPLAPLPEQHRIVAKIEELFTKLDVGVEALKKIKTQIKRYRQAVLKYAFEGKLTEEWREKHKDELKPVAEIVVSLKNNWRKKQGKVKMPILPENENSNSLPEGWIFLTLPWLTQKEKNAIKRGPFGSSIKKSYFVPSGGYKVYEQKNVIYNDFDRGNYFIDKTKYQELASFNVKPGDILISCSGTVGKIAMVPKNAKPGIINQALLKISLDGEIVLSDYFIKLFEFRTQEIVSGSTRGSAMLNISSVKDLKEIVFTIPQIVEQQVIMAEVEHQFSIAEKIEKTVDLSINSAERLRQSILKRAFEGKLVPQDPNDEPAAKLLERIKAEKAKYDNEKLSKKKWKRRTKLRRKA